MKATTTKKAKTKSNELNILRESCNTSDKNNLKSKSKGRGRPKGTTKKKPIEPILISEFEIIHKTVGLFVASIKNQPIPTKEFFIELCKHLIDEEKLIIPYQQLGLRIGEATTLKWSNKIGNEFKVRCIKQQNNKEKYRYIPLPLESWKILYEMQERGITEEGFVFNLRKSAKSGAFDEMLVRLSNRLCLDILIETETKAMSKTHKNLTSHMFRRSICTELWSNKVLDKDQLTVFMGHKEGDYRSLIHYLPSSSTEFNVNILEHFKGESNKIVGSLRESNLIDLMKEAMKQALKENTIKIEV